MASGYGKLGGTGRCFQFFRDFEDCMRGDGNFDCKLQYEDYMECLHHNKEVGRMEALMRRHDELSSKGELPKSVEKEKPVYHAAI
eukprot:CFRG1543T1